MIHLLGFESSYGDTWRCCTSNWCFYPFTTIPCGWSLGSLRLFHEQLAFTHTNERRPALSNVDLYCVSCCSLPTEPRLLRRQVAVRCITDFARMLFKRINYVFLLSYPIVLLRRCSSWTDLIMSTLDQVSYFAYMLWITVHLDVVPNGNCSLPTFNFICFWPDTRRTAYFAKSFWWYMYVLSLTPPFCNELTADV